MGCWIPLQKRERLCSCGPVPMGQWASPWPGPGNGGQKQGSGCPARTPECALGTARSWRQRPGVRMQRPGATWALGCHGPPSPPSPPPLFPACPAPVPRRVSLGSESKWGEETAASCLQACACQAPRGQPAHLASLGELKGHPFLAGLRATPGRDPIGWERNQTPCSAGPLRPWLQCLRGKGGHGSGGKALTWPCSSGG